MKTKLLSAGFLLAAAVSPLTQAGVTWNVTGGAGPTLDLGTFDWGPTSFAAENGNVAIANFINGSGATDFRVYSHAKLVGATNPSDVDITPAGLSSDYEYTMVMSFVEDVTAAVPALDLAAFVADPTKASWFEIYYDDLKDASGLASDAITGSGFRDGTLVMKGVLDNAATGNFTNDGTARDDLDSTGDGNQYTGQTTVTGAGSNKTLIWKMIAEDGSFFSDVDTLQMANISQSLAFISVNPSDCFTNNTFGTIGGTATDTECDTTHVDGVLDPATQTNGGGGFVPDVASVNGELKFDALGKAFVDSDDFVAQTDFNSPLTAAPVQAPEPGSMLLLGMGLLGMLGFSSKRKTS